MALRRVDAVSRERELLRRLVEAHQRMNVAGNTRVYDNEDISTYSDAVACFYRTCDEARALLAEPEKPPRSRAEAEAMVAELFPALSTGDGIYYITQERAMAPGIADGWPEVIPAPHTPHGRLVRRQFDRAALLAALCGEGT